MNSLSRTVAAAVILSLCACSSPPPKPAAPEGTLVPANGANGLEELVRAAVAAANPRAQKFSAARGETLKDALIRWAGQAQMQLHYQTTFNPVLTGAIHEPDIRAAALSLSILLQHEERGALIDFNSPTAITVTDIKKDQ
jgi:hypothetical protein